MKNKNLYLFLIFFFTNLLIAQNKVEAEKLVEEGIPYHDKGDYEGAINKYDKALALDKDNRLALSEKAFSLLALKEYDKTISICKLILKKFPNDNGLKTVYVTYGNALDGQNKTDKALEIYDEGINKFPDYYQLYYNKGVTYSSVKKNDEAIKCFQKALLINPKHSSSNNGIGRLEKEKGNRIASILGFCRFLIIEPQTNRSKENLASLKELLMQGVKKTGENAISLSIDSKDLDSEDEKVKENNFNSTNMILSMTSALDFDEKNKDKTEIENFIRKMETICASLSETKKSNFGFYWDYLAPYFVEMKKNNLLEPFAYIVFASSEDEYIKNWIKNDKTELDKFYNWSKEYNWNSKK
jgi:tetratricopeptide (TPR) repeat protein